MAIKWEEYTERPIEGYYVKLPIERLKFPHFTPEESLILRDFINSSVLDGEWFTDVKLPSLKSEYAKALGEPWYTMWKSLTAKRIDALCLTDDKIHLIEVKRYMLSSGIGQLIVYEKMFKEYYKPKKPIQLWYVTYYSDPDIIKQCEDLNIRWWSKY